MFLHCNSFLAIISKEKITSWTLNVPEKKHDADFKLANARVRWGMNKLICE